MSECGPAALMKQNQHIEKDYLVKAFCFQANTNSFFCVQVLLVHANPKRRFGMDEASSSGKFNLFVGVALANLLVRS